ncbi:hypothetical protein L9F63_020818, partial [Diploptera punctata]
TYVDILVYLCNSIYRFSDIFNFLFLKWHFINVNIFRHVFISFSSEILTLVDRSNGPNFNCLKTHQVLISRSPHLYMSPSSHCDDIKAMNNFLPTLVLYMNKALKDRHVHVPENRTLASQWFLNSSSGITTSDVMLRYRRVQVRLKEHTAMRYCRKLYKRYDNRYVVRRHFISVCECMKYSPALQKEIQSRLFDTMWHDISEFLKSISVTSPAACTDQFFAIDYSIFFFQNEAVNGSMVHRLEHKTE